jgi:hypothetical protein
MVTQEDPDQVTLPSDESQLPAVSGAETVDAIVIASKRRGHFRIRREFFQQIENGVPVPGPIAPLVKAGDLRALQLYLLLLTKASSEPWDSALPATVWARALGLPLPETKTARSTISKIWLRLERHGLVTRSRSKRWADVFLLREDGSGLPYTSPGKVGDHYIRVPLALWSTGPDESRRWYQVLSLPELAVLLIARSLSDGFWLPYERGPEWYGISADTIGRGMASLSKHELIHIDKTFKKAPLSAVGYTEERRYTLQPPFGPVGHRGSNPVPFGRTLRDTTLSAATVEELLTQADQSK